MSFHEIIEKSVEEVNKRAETDSSIKDILEQYDGKRVVLNILGDTTYTVTISSEGITLKTSEVPNPDDMFVEMDRKTADKLAKKEINPVQVMSMVLFGKIKARNIGAREVDLLKRFTGAF